MGDLGFDTLTQLLWVFSNVRFNIQRLKKAAKQAELQPNELSPKYLLTSGAGRLIQWREGNSHAFQEFHRLHAVIMEREFNFPEKHQHAQVKTRLHRVFSKTKPPRRHWTHLTGKGWKARPTPVRYL